MNKDQLIKELGEKVDQIWKESREMVDPLTSGVVETKK